VTMLGLSSLVGCGGGDTAAAAPPPPTPVSVKTVQLSISGAGAIESSTGQVCRTNCTIETQNSSIQLEPKPDAGSQFSGWQQDCAGVAGCALNLSSVSSAKATAVFQPVPVKLTVAVQGPGAIQVSGQALPCRSECEYLVTPGSVVTFTAIATAGAEFKSWSSLCGNSQTSCTTTIQQPLMLTATFVLPITQYSVQLNVSGQGSISSSSLSQPCTSSCTIRADEGSLLDLTAIPNADHQFMGWSTPCTAEPSCSTRVTAAMTLTATFAPLPVASNDDSNIIIVTNPQNVAVLNYPLQFARPFVAGEIAQFPQLVLNGQPIPTQADVKQRHPDGSVRHAIISAVLPQIGAGAKLTFGFVNQTTGRQQGVLDKAAMLGANFNFDASIEAKFADMPLHTVSARKMLEQDKYTYWTQGDIATTILLVDHSVERVFDFGADQHRSVRPAFYATFWPALNKVQVRYVGEITNTESLQDQTYDLVLKAGQDKPNDVYRRAALPHQAMTRWTKEYWTEKELPRLSINHNLAYLVKTTLLPNYIVKFRPTENDIAAAFNSWTSIKRDLYDAGLWQRAMGTAGGRPELGLYPAWTVRWLYSGDWRLEEIAMGQADLSGAWPMHVREGDGTRTFDEEQSISGLGRILSINQGGRPKAWIPRVNWHEITPKDKINPVNTLGSTSWRPDVPHHPDYASAQYLLTGDYYYLEQSLFSAAYTTMDNNAAATKGTLGRGPTGSEGALFFGEIRGQGWALRTRVHTASVLPDEMPEKKYFEVLTLKALAIWEGLYNISNDNTPYPQLWKFGREVIAPLKFQYSNGVPSPLGQWEFMARQNPDFVDEFYDYTKTAAGVSPWMAHIVVLSLGRAEELGFPATRMKKHAGQMIAGPALDNKFPLALLSSYRQPVLRQPDAAWFTSWSQVLDGYRPDFVVAQQARFGENNLPDAEFGYSSIVWASSSYLTDIPGGEVVYDFYNAWLFNRPEFNNNPKWAISPRK
jgi:hypothetical protein